MQFNTLELYRGHFPQPFLNYNQFMCDFNFNCGLVTGGSSEWLMHNSSIPTNLITTYKLTNFIVLLESQKLILRVDEYSKDLDYLHKNAGATSSAFITACNPHSEIYTVEQNAARQIELGNDLKLLGCMIIPGIGQSPDEEWPGEPSFLVIGIATNDGCKLGEKYGQNAIIFSGDDAIPKLVLLR